MVCDWDDFHAGNHRLDLLWTLKEANPAFRCTLFAIPGRGSDEFWASVPDWCELAVHGWMHPTARECENWSVDTMRELMAAKPARFVEGFKAPGWQISDGCYEALLEAGWWCADHYENNWRRPDGLRTHVLGEGDHWHGHIQDWGSNGLAESWDQLLPRVKAADRFDLISESVRVWRTEKVAA